MHIFDQICDYGPVHGFWTFTFERLNKTLKGYKTNNHGGGEIEVTFFREFHRDVRLRELVTSLSQIDGNIPSRGSKEVAKLLLESDGDDRGTLASLCREIDEEVDEGESGDRFGLWSTLQTDYMLLFSALKLFGTGLGDSKYLSRPLQRLFVEFYKNNHAYANVRARNAIIHGAMTITPNFLLDSVDLLEYIVLHGKRIVSATDPYHAPNSIIQVLFNGVKYVGQVIGIYRHSQTLVEGSTILIHTRWFRALERGVVDTSLWDI